jgi:peptide/nickel transport system substrate-binding protein
VYGSPEDCGPGPLYNPDVAQYTFDPQAGSALLEEIGWVDHDGDPATARIYRGNDSRISPELPLEFNYWTTAFSGRPETAQILVDSLAQCGIRINVEIKSAEELFASGTDGLISSRQFDMAQLASQSGNQPSCEVFLQEQIPGDPALLDTTGQPLYPNGWSGSNVTGYSDPEYEQACKAALSTIPGQPGYIENHLKAQEIFARDLPVIPLYSHFKVAATRPDMCGFALDPTADSEMWNIEEFDYGEGCK